ncbi:MAG: hypothetical protein QOH63_1598 [Acidobacteriota bacterium]|jgi:hypothetical protein|nr:hypothetical protein [Acidobacteriota bacterium]
MSDETVRFLIEQKMSYVNSAVNICMLWWASSIVFSGSILAAVWSQKEALVEPLHVIALGIAIFIFFFGIADFGLLAAKRLGLVQREIADLAHFLNYGMLIPEENFFHTEIETFQMSMRLGAGSFALICAVWSAFWMYLSGRWWCICAILIVIWSGLWICFFRKILEKWFKRST